MLVSVDALVSFGVPVVEACRRIGLPRISYYRAKKKGRSPAKESGPEMATLAGGSQSIPAPDGAGGPDSVEEI